ncbi:MAG: hypothetical protein GF418_15965 [Chitinivibrionales bacterium]|nr:hypothetical protein [Chitinivibrionales bacterium]
MVNRKAVMDRMMKLSPLMANRMDSFERELAEMAEKRRGAKLLGTQGLTDKAKELSMKGIGLIDFVTAATLWQGKYLEVMARAKNVDRAVAAADEVVRKTQSQGGIVHLPRLYRAGGIARAYTMFTNDLNQRINLLFETISDKSKGTPERAHELFWYMFVPSVMMYMASTGGRLPWKDPEGWAEQFLTDLWGGFILVNQVLDAGASYLLNKSREARGAKADKSGLRYLLDFAPASMGALEDLGWAVATGNPWRLVEASAKLSGIPYAQFRRTSRGFQKAMETRDARYLVWSEHALRETGNVAEDMRSRLTTPRGWQDRIEFLRWYDNLPARKRRQFIEDTPGAAKHLQKLRESLAGQLKQFERSGARARKQLQGAALEAKLNSIRQERLRFLRERRESAK